MSKEQTPIEELIELCEEGLSKLEKENNWSNELWLVKVRAIQLEEKEKQHTQAKVLEALERDLKDLSDCYKAHAEDNPKKEVCQVLHTLIMEKQEQIAQTKQK